MNIPLIPHRQPRLSNGTYKGVSRIKTYDFTHRDVLLQNLANSGFYESLAAWLESQTRAGDLPVLPKGKKAQAIEAQSTGYLFTSGPDTGKYQIQCRLQYFQEV